jgi:hypothetical protein
VEAVFRPKIFWIFSDDFRPVLAGKHRKLIGIHRTKSGQFPVGILLPCSSDFLCFPAGSGDFLVSFLRDPVAGIMDLGISRKCYSKDYDENLNDEIDQQDMQVYEYK